LSSLDLLSVCQLVNYFGKSDNIDDVTIYPILIKKGQTKLAIYGLGMGMKRNESIEYQILLLQQETFVMSDCTAPFNKRKFA
jgi:hypothetical protein